MITKIGKVAFDENRIDFYKKLSLYCMMAGLFMFLLFPFLSERIYISEKQLKNSDVLYNQLKYDFFINSIKQFNDYENLVKNSIEVHSQRGERNKFIMINSIYDETSLTNLYVIYSLINHFSIKENFMWLTKDIQFNFIQKDDFYNNSERIIKRLSSLENNKVKEGQMIDSVINLDFTTLDFAQTQYFLLKINGASSENLHMDYYKIFFDNFNRFLREDEMRTVDYYFSKNIKFYLKNIFYNIGSLVEGFIPKNKKNTINYKDDCIYLLENLFQNYILADEKINSNHLFISKNMNSILIKGIRKSRNNKEIKDHNESSNINKRIKKAFEFVLALERVLKNLSKIEIEIHRGEFNYIMCSSHSFVGAGLFLFIPVLCILRIFYEVLSKIYKTEYKIYSNENSILASKVISHFIISFIIQFLLFLHIEQIQNFVSFSVYSTFIHILIINFVISFLHFRIMKLNKDEEVFADNIIRYIIGLNCFNFFFINYGIGLIMTVSILPLEVLLTHIHERMNRTFIQIFAIGFLMYCMLMDRGIVENVINNYIGHFNNIYPILTFVLIYFLLRINLIIRRRLNMKDRIIIRTASNSSLVNN